MSVFGYSGNGLDLRFWTGSTLHWMGCFDGASSCPTSTFYCSYSSSSETLEFGTTASTTVIGGTMRAIHDYNDANLDQIPASSGNAVCCSTSLMMCNAPDSNNNGVGVSSATALCRALGYKTGVLVTEAKNNYCPEVHALDATGQRWNTDYEWSAGDGRVWRCSGFDWQECESFVYGPDCDKVCPGGRNNPCNGHGSCSWGRTGTGKCTCYSGWKGDACEYSDAVNCNNHGTWNNGKCTCHTGWAGDTCNQCATYYYPANVCNVYCNPATTCNGKGTCTSSGTCSCSTGYAGTNCDRCATNYYGYPNCRYCVASTTCNGRGSCTSSGSCSCNTGFGGEYCTQCLSGYYGSSCTPCPGGASNPCNGRGICSDGMSGSGVCTCQPGFAGNACQYSDAVTCSGNGKAQNDGSCQCYQGYAGANCNSCATNYYRDGQGKCTKYCHPAETCNSHGTCDSTGACKCNTGFKGTWCEQCADGYYNYPVCSACSAATTCNGRGVCTAQGTCACIPTAQGTYCENCIRGYYGSQCNQKCPGLELFGEPCAGHGTCSDGVSGTGKCTCHQGYSGADCGDPAITSVTPTNGPTEGGTQMIVDGRMFHTNGSVILGTSPPLTLSGSQLLIYTDTRIIFNMPPVQPPSSSGRITIKVKRDVDGKETNAVDFTLDAPVISSLSPSSGSTAGLTVTVSGSNFGTSAEVVFDGTVLSAFMSTLHKVLTFTVPPGVGKSHTVAVRVAGRSSAAVNFAYSAPTISAVSGIGASTTGNADISITGTNFGPSGLAVGLRPEVTVAGQTCTYKSNTHTQIVCTLPAGSGAGRELKVTVAGQSATSTYSYAAPVISTVRGCVEDTEQGTALCDPTGKDTITITGNNFGPSISGGSGLGAANLRVEVGGLECTNLQMLVAHTWLTCTLPRGTGIQVPVSVIRGTQSDTKYLVSYAAPALKKGTLRRVGGSVDLDPTGAAYVTIPDTNPSNFQVQFEGEFLGDSQADLKVFFGPPSDPQRFEGTTISLVNGLVTAAVPAGVGRNLYVSVKRVASDLTSQQSADYISYPKPVITTGTLRLQDQERPSGSGPSQVTGTGTAADILVFEGDHFGTWLSEVTVHYGPLDDLERYLCAVVSVTDTQIECSTQRGEGGPYYFVVKAGRNETEQTSDPGQDEFRYPQAPSITKITGCSPDPALPGEGTADCPTTGTQNGAPVLLTIEGVNFGSSPTVTVNYKECLGVTVLQTDTKITCRLPASTGRHVPVVVSASSNLFSMGHNLVSYALPSVTEVTGCSATESPLHTAECPRDGGTKITIRGANFGALGAKVMVGTERCQNVMHVGTKHDELTCELPAGTQLSRPLLVVQDGGEFSETPAFVSYKQCAPGTFAERETDVQCTPCPAGYYSNVEGSRSCLPCEIGTYSADGATACTKCAAGSFSSESASTSCTLCPEGYSQDSEGAASCTICPAGSYSDEEGATACKKCNVGYYQPEAGKNKCEACAPGSFASVDGRVQCERCEPGYFAEGPGATACSKCPAGTVPNTGSSPGATGCEPTDYGEYTATEGQAVPFQCGIGRYAPDRGMSECATCEPGKFAPSAGASMCQNCTAGTYSLSGAAKCDACPKGFYSSEPGMSSCAACSPGYFQSKDGQASCDPCPAGYFQGASGQPACEPCPPGTVTTEPGKSACSACEPGTRSEDASGASTACVACEEGTYTSLSGLATCQPCERGKFMNATGATGCIPCEPGKYADQGRATACVACPPGRIAPASGAYTCDICPAGRYSSDDRLQCLPCPAGTHQLSPEKDRCEECPVGYFSSTSAAATCSPCGPGKYTNATGLTECFSCPAGTFSAGGENELLGAVRCDPCPKGTYQQLSGQAECLPCAWGTFSNVSGSEYCLKCPGGKFASSTGSVECTPCAAGYYMPSEGQTDCFACEAGTYSAEPGASACTECPAGRSASSQASTECSLCQPGEYNPFARQPKCLECSAGSFSNDTGATACILCQPGQYQDERGKTSCMPCPAGTNALTAGNALCIDCSQGRFSPKEGATECEPCPAGTYASTLRSVSCAPCPAGKFNANPGQEACKNCPAGRYADREGMEDCIDCAPGNATALEGSTTCEPCAVGRFAQTRGQDICLPCPAGTYTDFNGTVQCLPCPAGKVAPLPGSSVCEDCLAGTYTDVEGLSSCKHCPLGYYADRDGMVECQRCPPTTYAGTVRSTNCTACPPGTALNAGGQSACLLCEPGRYSATFGSATCLACPVGKAQGAEGQTQCYDCFVGMAGPAMGLSACEICKPGKFAATTGQAECTECPPGRFQDESGRTNCRICLAGTYATRGSSVCSRCHGTQIAPVDGMGQCVQCDVGAVANDEGTSCVCGEGYYLDDSELVDGGAGSLPEADDEEGSNTTVPTLHCKVCPAGARCDLRDIRYSTMETLPGWWRADNRSLTFYRCIVPSHCLGGFNSECAENREGPLCSLCKPGYKSSTSRAKCEKCPEKARSIVASVFIIFIIALVLLIMYWFVLKSASDAEEDTIRQDKKQIQWEEAGLDEFIMNTMAGFDQEDVDKAREIALQSQKGRVEGKEAAVRRRSRANVTTKLKIMLSFFQIVTQLSFSVDIPYPSYYQSFINAFSFLQLDFVPWQSLSCASPFSYYTKYITVMALPVGIAICIVLFFLLPLYIRDRLDMSDSDVYRAARKRTRRKFWRLALFTVFLMYPHVSSMTLSYFVCRTVNNTSYLVEDFTELCFEGTWLTYLPLALVCTILYPIGVPAFFFFMLHRYRKRLQEPGVHLQLGFLYEAYNLSGGQVYFECVDMLNKLFMTSLIPFLNPDYQMPTAMAWTFLFMLYLLYFSPYLRKGDDRLHLFAEVEVLMLVLMGYILYQEGDSYLDDRTDLLLSILLIALTVALIVVFFLMAAKNAFKMWRAWVRKKLVQAEKEAAAEKNVSDVLFEANPAASVDAREAALAAQSAGGIVIANPLFAAGQHAAIPPEPASPSQVEMQPTTPKRKRSELAMVELLEKAYDSETVPRE